MNLVGIEKIKLKENIKYPFLVYVAFVLALLALENN